MIPFELLSQKITKVAKSDPESAMYFSALNGKQFLCSITLPIRQECYIFIESDAIKVAFTPLTESCAATFSGSALAFMQIATSNTTAAAAGVSIDGNTADAEQLFHWVKHIQIDWEEMIADVIGDHAAYLLLSPVKAIFNWKSRYLSDLSTTTSEYLRFESRSLPCHAEVSKFSQSVDSLSADVGRLEAKIQRLTR